MHESWGHQSSGQLGTSRIRPLSVEPSSSSAAAETDTRPLAPRPVGGGYLPSGGGGPHGGPSPMRSSLGQLIERSTSAPPASSTSDAAATSSSLYIVDSDAFGTDSDLLSYLSRGKDDYYEESSPTPTATTSLISSSMGSTHHQPSLYLGNVDNDFSRQGNSSSRQEASHASLPGQSLFYIGGNESSLVTTSAGESSLGSFSPLADNTGRATAPTSTSYLTPGFMTPVGTSLVGRQLITSPSSINQLATVLQPKPSQPYVSSYNSLGYGEPTLNVPHVDVSAGGLVRSQSAAPAIHHRNGQAIPPGRMDTLQSTTSAMNTNGVAPSLSNQAPNNLISAPPA